MPSRRPTLPTIAILRKLNLWDHQRDAIRLCRRYLAHFSQGITDGSALVHIPTGSGKTGVIATVSRCLPGVGSVLILSPRVSLRDQLHRDVSGGFFTKIKYAGPLPKTVYMLDDSVSGVSPSQSNTSVLIATVQKIHSMAQKDQSAFRRLASSISLVIFDEGHYEPAMAWSQTIRELQKPKIIFTATPYRNDLKYFDLDSKYIYSLTYHSAVKDRYLREVEVIPRPSTNDPNKFVQDVIDHYKKYLNFSDKEPARVIIRCDRVASIEQIAEALKARNHECVAIHEQFSDDKKQPWKMKHVPPPDSQRAVFWIHQFKLLEGIDDPRFKMLALFEPLRTARPFVQQVGRIIRNPERRRNAKAYVLDHTGGKQLDLWTGFLKYDRQIDEKGPKALSLALGDEFTSKFISAQPAATYIDGRFRSPFDLSSLNPLS